MDETEQQEKDSPENFYEKLENLAKKLSSSVREDLVPEAEKKFKENPFLSMALSFLTGILVAFIITAGGRRGN